jgi:hypothetical protein
MGVRNWKRAAQKREEWMGLIREAKAHIGLLRYRRRRRRRRNKAYPIGGI